MLQDMSELYSFIWLNTIPLLPGFVSKVLLVHSHARIGKSTERKQSGGCQRPGVGEGVGGAGRKWE